MQAFCRKALAFALIWFGAIAAAGAQTYPTHTVRMIIPSAPGGASDTFGRLMAAKLSQITGQSFVPENVPGAGTMIASEQLAHAAPDGYTILFVTGSHAVNAAIHKKLRYDPIKDFSTVSLVASLPQLLLVNPGVPAHSVSELIALAKKNPGHLTMGSAGPGSTTHLVGLQFQAAAGIKMLHVPYKGGSRAVTALTAGEIQVMLTNPVEALTLVRSDRLHALGISSEKRLPLLPDVPTISEAGLPGFLAESWYGVLVPANTPPAVVSTLNRAVNQVLAMPDVREKIASFGGIVKGGTPQEFSTYMIKDIEKWRDLVKATPALQHFD